MALIPNRKQRMAAFEAWLVAAEMLAAVAEQINDL